MTLPTPEPAHTSVLSPRERQVLWLKACGLTGEQAGHGLHLSEQTIKNHLTSSFRKLGAHSATHALALALRRGELDLAAPPPEMPALATPEELEDRARTACKVCGVPRAEDVRLTRGRCKACYTYLQLTGEERPERLHGRPQQQRRYRGARIPDTD